MNKVSNNNILSFTLSLGLVLALFLAGNLRVIGYLGVALIMISMLLKNIYSFKNGKIKINIPIACMILYLIFHYIYFTLKGTTYIFTNYHFLQQLSIYIYLYFLSCCHFEKDFVKSTAKTTVYLFIFVSLGLLLSGKSQLAYSVYFTTQFGMFILPIFAFLFIGIKDHKKRLLIAIYLLIAVFLSGARSALISIALFMILYLLFKKKILNLRKNKLLLYIIIALCILIPIAYIQLSNNVFGLRDTLNAIFMKYTNSKLFTGRDRFWPLLIEQIQSHPVFGNGIGMTMFDINNLNLSTHNLFFFILLQEGVVGLILFVNIIRKIWNHYINMEDENKEIYALFLIVLLVQQTFSLGLLSGKMGFALLCWTLIGLGLGNKEKMKG